MEPTGHTPRQRPEGAELHKRLRAEASRVDPGRACPKRSPLTTPLMVWRRAKRVLAKPNVMPISSPRFRRFAYWPVRT